ncbi:MAG: protein kinase [Bryobacteraceae bacterium]|jgi:predicted Ser/Thr protein kinase/WD40 repeat protein
MTMPLSNGTRLGPYEILAPLGAGGMGEVYRSRDTRLGRDVALKILPPDLANDPSRRQRFELEARAVAALNHPNIVAIYDVGDGYIVSELVEGESLRGAKLGLRKTLDIAVQIAAGLAAAHDAGITHRDLKPDNILLTSDGRVKLLDFGLAKMAASRSAAAAMETLTVHTEPGMVLGTVGYMSPEQVRGQTADHRSDIFNFGLILYELLTGKRAFHAGTHVETMTAILKEEAPELPETVPPGVRQIAAHCLEKNPINRFQSAHDLGFALTAVAQSGSHSAAAALPAARWRWRSRAVPALAALALIAATLAGARLWLRAPAPPAWTGVLLGGPEIAAEPRPSPDGHWLAFTDIGSQQVGLMKPESGNWTILTHASDQGSVYSLGWSADGTRIYYDRWTDVPRGIYSVPVPSGEERLVLEDAATPVPLPDGSLLMGRYNAERQYQLFRYWPETGRLQGFSMEVMVGITPSICAFPDGQEAVVIGTLIGPGREAGQHLYAVNLQTGKTRRLLPDSQNDSAFLSVIATRDGKSILAAGAAGNVAQILSIPRSGRGSPTPLLSLTNTVFAVDSGADGSIYVDQVDRPVDLLRFSVQGGHVERIATLPAYEAPGAPYLDSESFAILPDGRVVLTQGTGGRLRLMAVETGKDPVPLIDTAEETTAPVTVAGPNEIAFLIGPEPRRTIALAAVSNGRIIRRIPFDKGPIHSLAASPDGKTLYCAAGGAVWSIPVAGGEPKKIRAGDYVAIDPAGRDLIVEMSASPIIRLIGVPLNGGPEQEIPRRGPLRPAFLIGPNAIGPDGRIVMSLGSSTWYWPPGVIDPLTGQITRIPVDYIDDVHVLGWTPDGKVMALGLGFRSKMWKFTPQAR